MRDEPAGTREVPEWERKLLERWGSYMQPRDPSKPLPTFETLEDGDRLEPGLQEQFLIMTFDDGRMVGAVCYVEPGWRPERLTDIKWIIPSHGSREARRVPLDQPQDKEIT